MKQNMAAEGTRSHMRRWGQGELGAIRVFVEQEACAFGSGGARVLNPECHAAEIAHIFLRSTVHGSCEVAVSRKERERKARDRAQCCAI